MWQLHPEIQKIIITNGTLREHLLSVENIKQTSTTNFHWLQTGHLKATKQREAKYGEKRSQRKFTDLKFLTNRFLRKRKMVGALW